MRFPLPLCAILLAGCSASIPAVSLAVGSISPDHGPEGGGTLVTISGSGLTHTKTVAFGSTLSRSVNIVSDTTLIAVTPAGSGVSSVVVFDEHYGAQGPVFSYGPVPHTFSITPSHGAGGIAVRLRGGNLLAVTQVLFGTVPATFTVDNDTQITAVAPPSPGVSTVTVTVVTPYGASNGIGFAYAADAPTLSGLSPASGPVSGGNVVTVTGTSFGGATMVTFGGVMATEVQLLSATSLTVTAPAGSGTVDVLLSTPSGTSNALSYTYVGPMP